MSEIAEYFDKVRERTMRVAACIPPEQIEWTYKPGKYTLYCTVHPTMVRTTLTVR